jgi:hypothetical protein
MLPKYRDQQEQEPQYARKYLNISGFFFKESKVSSELVPIQELAPLVNKEGLHLPTGKYHTPVVTEEHQNMS